MAELVERSGVPRATVKYYLREGLVPPGAARGATQAEYDESHLRRLHLVRVLVGSVGLSLAAVRRVVDAATRGGDRFAALGAALAALPPDPVEVDPGVPRARAALEALGLAVEPGYPPTRQLERALSELEDAGTPVRPELLAVYGEHLRAIARAEVDGVRVDGEPDVERAVLGTVLHEPLLLALRRLLHREVSRTPGDQ